MQRYHFSIKILLHLFPKYVVNGKLDIVFRSPYSFTKLQYIFPLKLLLMNVYIYDIYIYN